MSIFEYDEEKYLKSEREVWRKEGREEGRSEGISIGHKSGYEEAENRFSKLTQILIEAKRDEDMKRAVSDSDYRKQLYLEYHL